MDKDLTDKRDKPIILVVDDLVDNLQAIGNTLLSNGYEVAMAMDGKKAVEITQTILPDLILLDIAMPEMDGFEVCKFLKSQPSTKDIPIIFLTAQKDMENVVKGFKMGAVDYMIKPVKREESLARIKTHLDLKFSREIILKQNEMLKKMIKEKDEFLALASTDLRNPINDIRGNNDLIKKIGLVNNLKELKEYSNNIDNSTKTMMNIINDLLYLNDIEQGKIKSLLKSFNIDLLIHKVIKEFEHYAKLKRINITFDSLLERNFLISSDQDKTEVILTKLISNAIKFSTFYKNVQIRTEQIEEMGKNLVLIQIIDNGVGMTQEDLELIFTKFAKLSSKPTNNESSAGLGLSIAKALVDEIGGKIWFESIHGKGTTAFVTLPVM
jgi:two-component system, sensor histidine kinase and response regulator